ncbi:MAG: hypothetical protein GX073_09655 [Firmicutes bacterium]|nr:hypothetical protein [Bacillota bacterium]
MNTVLLKPGKTDRAFCFGGRFWLVLGALRYGLRGDTFGLCLTEPAVKCGVRGEGGE